MLLHSFVRPGNICCLILGFLKKLSDREEREKECVLICCFTPQMPEVMGPSWELGIPCRPAMWVAGTQLLSVFLAASHVLHQQEAQLLTLSTLPTEPVSQQMCLPLG